MDCTFAAENIFPKKSPNILSKLNSTAFVPPNESAATLNKLRENNDEKNIPFG